MKSNHQAHNEVKIIDLNSERQTGHPVELTPHALAMIEEAHRAAAHARAREEATHRLMARELAERDARRARDRRTIQRLAVIGFLLIVTVFSQIFYIRDLVGRLGDARARNNILVPGALRLPAGPGPQSMPRLRHDPKQPLIMVWHTGQRLDLLGHNGAASQV